MKIRVHSKREGFRRAGLVFGREAVSLDTEELGEDRLAALEADSMLVIEHLEQTWTDDKVKTKNKGDK